MQEGCKGRRISFAMSVYIVAGVKSWNKHIFDEIIARYPGTWHFIDDPIVLLDVDKLAPDYIFFLHWSWKVPTKIVSKYECICFHMTDVPYGRGGSPLQNLMVRGHDFTKLTAMRMVEGLDKGPVYLQRELSLEGSAESIYIRASHLAAHMIEHIIYEHPEPESQTGEVVTFRRRKPEESRIIGVLTPPELDRFIRMLDAEGYPRAFIEYGPFRYEFSRAALYGGGVVRADVTITPIKGGKEDEHTNCSGTPG